MSVAITDGSSLIYLQDDVGTLKLHTQLLSDRLKLSYKVSNIGFITVHGLNEGHIAPYTDIEFQLTKYQTYITMKFQDSK